MKKAAEKAEREVKAAKMSSMPANVAMWSVDDVTRWLETLSLGQYVEAFKEATVDGAFLMELREEDLVQVLGVSHKLHVRKIIISRERLRPLTKDELAKKEQVEAEVSIISHVTDFLKLRLIYNVSFRIRLKNRDRWWGYLIWIRCLVRRGMED